MRLLPVCIAMLTTAAALLWWVAIFAPVSVRALGNARSGAEAATVLAALCLVAIWLGKREQRQMARERALIRTIDGMGGPGDMGGGGHPSGPLHPVR